MEVLDEFATCLMNAHSWNSNFVASFLYFSQCRITCLFLSLVTVHHNTDVVDKNRFTHSEILEEKAK